MDSEIVFSVRSEHRSQIIAMLADNLYRLEATRGGEYIEISIDTIHWDEETALQRAFDLSTAVCKLVGFANITIDVEGCGN